MTAVSIRRLEAAVATLGDLSAEEHPELDGELRDEIGQVIHCLELIIARRQRGDR